MFLRDKLRTVLSLAEPGLSRDRHKEMPGRAQALEVVGGKGEQEIETSARS